MILNKFSFLNPSYYWRNPDTSTALFTVQNNGGKSLYIGKAEDLNKLYLKKTSTDFDLDKMKKVFFDPTCTYPRYKLSQFTKVKRCVDPSKADAIIISKTTYRNDWTKYHIFYDSKEDHYYLISENYFERDMKNIYTDTNLTKQEKFIKHVKYHNLISNDLVYISLSDVVILTKDAEKSVELLSHNHKLILDSDLDAAISKTLNKVEESDVESIDELLASSDISTVGLGMDLLINYDVAEKACTMGMLLFKHRANILRSSKINSVGFKNILEVLKISKSDLSYYNENGKLHYINKLYGIATNEEDKRLAYKIAVEIVQQNLDRSFEAMKDVVNNLGIKADIKAY